MNIKLKLIILSALLPMLAMQSCSDDEPKIREFNFMKFHEGTHSQGSVVSVKSEANHQSGQKHRSSDNFSTKTLIDAQKGEPEYMLVTCPDNVTFNINVDKSGADEQWTYDVYNGAILSFRNSDKLYIADPSGASAAFDITFTAVFPSEDHVFVSCPGRVRSGQDHRASTNFVLPSDYARFRVSCTDPSVTFGIYEDVSGASDNKIALNVKDGDYINISVSKHNYYLTDPQNASGAFQVLFEPVTVEWMSKLDDSLLISDISIPGTHDAGTYKLEPVNFGYSKCQNMSISQQLEAGIRFLDLRVDGSMDICHGGLWCNLSFDEVVRTTCSFLTAHPDETVIFQITGESSFQKKFQDYRNAHGDLAAHFWLNNYVPKLSEVRGKIMIVRRYAASQAEGLDFYSKDVWPDDDVKEGTNPDGIKYYIEDRFYYAGDTDDHDTHEKRDLLNAAIDYKLDNPGVLTFAFASISASMSHTPYQFMWGGGAPAVNPQMGDVLVTKLSTLQSKVSCTGIIPMDYPCNNGHDDYCHVVELIINTNFPAGSKPFDLQLLHSSYDK